MAKLQGKRRVLCLPGLGKGVLGALSLFLLVVCTPAAGLAAVSYGIDMNYQQSNTTSGSNTSSSTQERFSFYFNMNSRPSSRLALDGILRFDVLNNVLDPGSKSTDVQPDLELRLSTSALQLGVGYRRDIRNENIISGTRAQTLTDDISEAYVDSTIRAGKLPTFRVRYSLRDEKQNTDGTVNVNNSTKDLEAALSYRLGIFAVDADYRSQDTADNMAATTSNQTDVAGQLSLARRLGTKMDVSLRENYNYDQSTTDNKITSKAYTSISEGRLVYNPFMGANINTNYIYRIADASSNGTDSPLNEKTWFTSVNYAFPKFFRIYGSYSDQNTDSNNQLTQTSTGVAGINFANTVGRLSIASRYERRWDMISSADGTGSVTSSSTTTHDNFDWVVAARLASILNTSLSESYVADRTQAGVNQSNRFRLTANVGPMRNLMLSPYVEYVMSSPETGPGSTQTDIVFPATFRVSLNQKLELDLADNYHWTTVQQQGTISTTTQSNNAIFRLILSRPLPNTSFLGDATFTTNISTTGQTTNTSAYSVRGTWASGPNSLSGTVLFQTGTDTPNTTTMAFLYGLNLRMKKIAFGFQARYDYSIILSTPQSTAQTVYLMMTLRK